MKNLANGGRANTADGAPAMTQPAAQTEGDHPMTRGGDQVDEHQTIVERAIEREMRERLR
jgi:hypothetical protein